MNKKIFFNQNGITVSKSRLFVHGELYEINKIASLRYKVLPADYSYSVLAFLIGGMLMLDEGALFALGGCLVLLGVVTGVAAHPRHVIVLDMPEGAKEAVVSMDQAHVERVILAIQAAIGSDKQVEPSELRAHDLEDEAPFFISRVVE